MAHKYSLVLHNHVHDWWEVGYLSCASALLMLKYLEPLQVAYNLCLTSSWNVCFYQSEFVKCYFELEIIQA